LILVSPDLARGADAAAIAPTLQRALDQWRDVERALRDLYARLADGREKGFAFDPAKCASPLPRAYQWADGSAYVNHVDLVRRARGAKLPSSFWTDPLIYQGASDAFLGPCDPIELPDENWGIDFEAEIAIVMDDVPLGASRLEALDAIRLVMLCNDVSLRSLIPGELSKGFGFFQSKPASAFSPVAVTPDILGEAWRGGMLHLPLRTMFNGALFGMPNAGVDMTFDFGTLIAHAARSRRLSAGTIIGSGTVSNRDADGGPGKPVHRGGVGYSCIAELRMIETIEKGHASTPFMKAGDSVRIEMRDHSGLSIFGAIEQCYQPLSETYAVTA
jgi:fumarylacetoacetate (FAA) hydrolase